MTLSDTNLRSMTVTEAIALGTATFSAWCEAHATCRKCGRRLPSEREIRNAAKPIPEARMFELSSFKSATRGGACETFDTVCLPCGEWNSVKSMINRTIKSGDTITFPRFGKEGFDHARTSYNDNAFFQITDMTGKVTNVPFTAIVSAVPSARKGKGPLVTVTVIVP